jgi:hypothetical protein
LNDPDENNLESDLERKLCSLQDTRATDKRYVRSFLTQFVERVPAQ